MTSKGVGFECFSNTEEDVFLGLFGAGSDSDEEDTQPANKSQDVAEIVEEPFDENSYTEAVYRIPESARDDSIDSNIEVVLIERKHLGIAHQLWPAAGFLCEFFLKHKTWLLNECIKENTGVSTKPSLCVLELGAGIGLCGMYLGALMQQTCETKVLLTDLPGALDGLNENINRNDLNPSVQAKVLSWGDSSEFDAVMAEYEGQTPLVIAADCVYWECLYEPLFQTIKSLMSKNCKVIISHVRRWKKDGKFFAMCKKAGYSVSVWVEEVKTVPAEHTGVPTRQVTRIYCIENKLSVNPAASVINNDIVDVEV